MGAKLPLFGALAIVVVAVLWFVFLRGDSTPVESASPPAAGGAAAEGPAAEATMSFVNTAAVPVGIYWVDDGLEELYATLQAEDSLEQPTAVGDLWVVRTIEGDGALEVLTCRADAAANRCVIELVTGWTVLAVEFGNADGDFLGSYRTIADGVWVEEGPDGTVRFEFEETDRDDWSVYLHDDTRGIDIEIDLWDDIVWYADGDNPPVELYEVFDARE